MKFKKLICFIVIVNVCLNINVAFAVNVNELVNKQGKIEQKKDVMESKIKEIKNEKKTVQAQLEEINNKLSTVQNNLTSINNELANNQSKIVVLEKEIEQTNKDIDERQETLETRLKVSYENGENTYLDVLFTSDTLTDFLSRADIVKQLALYDKELLDEMNQEKIELNYKKNTLEVTKKKIEQSKKQFELLKKEQLKNKNLKDQLIGELTEEQRKIEREYELLERESNQIAVQIRNAQKSSQNTKYAGGMMLWPAPGYYTVTSPFGMRFHPILKTNKMHTGIDIGAPSGANIVAANAGTVISASYMSGYGNTVVIDHGGGLSTLYAHNSSLSVSVGQKVTKGQSVAKAGSTGNSTGPHLHFEVRSNGNPVNPMTYIK